MLSSLPLQFTSVQIYLYQKYNFTFVQLILTFFLSPLALFSFQVCWIRWNILLWESLCVLLSIIFDTADDLIICWNDRRDRERWSHISSPRQNCMYTIYLYYCKDEQRKKFVLLFVDHRERIAWVKLMGGAIWSRSRCSLVTNYEFHVHLCWLSANVKGSAIHARLHKSIEFKAGRVRQSVVGLSQHSARVGLYFSMPVVCGIANH